MFSATVWVTNKVGSRKSGTWSSLLCFDGVRFFLFGGGLLDLLLLGLDDFFLLPSIQFHQNPNGCQQEPSFPPL